MNVISMDLKGTSLIYAALRTDQTFTILAQISQINGDVTKAMKIKGITDINYYGTGMLISKLNNIFFVLNNLQDKEFYMIKFQKDLKQINWIIRSDCASQGAQCQMNTIINEIRGVTSQSLIIGGVMEDANDKYLSIYDINSNSFKQQAFYYQRKDGSNEKNVDISIQEMEVDYQDGYVFACYNAVNPSNDKEFILPTGDDATCIGMNYLSSKRISMFYSRWDNALSQHRVEYIFSTLAQYNTEGLNPPTTVEHYAVAQYPNTASNIYISIGFNKNQRMRYVIGTMPGRVFTSKTASVIFSLENYDECFAPESFSSVSIPSTVIYEQILTSVPSFNLITINQADSVAYFEELKSIFVKDDLRVKQGKYNSTPSCNQPNRLNLKYVLDINASRFNNECYYESNTCDLQIAYYALSSCSENIAMTFQFVSQNNTEEILFSKNSTTSSQEQYLSLSRTELQNFESLKFYSITVRAIFYLDNFEYAVSSDLTVKSNDVKDIGNYTLVVQLFFDNHLDINPPSNFIGDIEIGLNINEFNNAPYFSTKQLENQIAVSGQQKSYNLPEVLDWEGDSYQIVLESKALEIFTNLIDKKLVFSPQDQNVGVYKVKIRVQQLNDKSASNTYSFKLSVIKGEQNQQNQNPELNGIQVPSSALYNSETDTWSESASSLYSGDDKIIREYLKVKIAFISSTGETTLLFDSQMMIPNNSALTLNDSLSILLVQNAKKYKVDYSITSFQGQMMKVQLKFPIDTKYISVTQVPQIYIIQYLQFDQLRVTFVKNLFYRNSKNDKVLAKRYQVSKSIPPQIDKGNISLISIFQAVLDQHQVLLQQYNILYHQSSGQILLQISFCNLRYQSQTFNDSGFSLQQLWNIFEGFQFITHLPLIQIILPSNTLYFFGFINDIASLNLIPVDNINSMVYDYDTFNDQPYNEYFGMMNYTSVNSITDLGLLYYFYLLHIFVIIIAIQVRLLNLTKQVQYSFNYLSVFQNLIKEVL
eukprot:403352077